MVTGNTALMKLNNQHNEEDDWPPGRSASNSERFETCPGAACWFVASPWIFSLGPNMMTIRRSYIGLRVEDLAA